MNLFFKRLFGILENTNKMEQRDDKLFAEFINYKRFERSDDYAEYKRLFEIVKSADFKTKRNQYKPVNTKIHKNIVIYSSLKS